MVGGFNTVLGWALFALVQELVGVHLGRFGHMASLYLSDAVGIFIAYLTQRVLVFRARGRFWFDFARFVVVKVVGLGLNTLLLPLVIETTHAEPMVAQIGVSAVVAVLSFFGHKWFSFGAPRSASILAFA